MERPAIPSSTACCAASAPRSCPSVRNRLCSRATPRCGSGGRHEAALNFGDCFSYALAVARGEPLLFVGDDFAKTDVEVCVW